MEIRAWANKNPKVVACLVGAVIVLACALIVYQVMSSRRGYSSSPPNFFFTVDDGKTFFVDRSDHYAPYDYKGQTAVHAYVFQCGSTKFVGFLERYLPDVKAKLDSGTPMTPEMVRYGREIKRPGEPTWTKTGDLTLENKIENVGCPDGSGGVPDEIEP